MRLAPPRPIEPSDPLDDFDCGEPSLNAWLSRQALRSEREHTARTYVLLDTDGARVGGYYCLSAYSVGRDGIGGGALARNAPTHVPAVLLGRLAVDQRYQGHGIGVSLLHDAIRNTLTVAERIGSRALIVDALHESAAAFYRHHGFRPFPADPLRLYHRL